MTVGYFNVFTSPLDDVGMSVAHDTKAFFPTAAECRQFVAYVFLWILNLVGSLMPSAHGLIISLNLDLEFFTGVTKPTRLPLGLSAFMAS